MKMNRVKCVNAILAIASGLPAVAATGAVNRFLGSDHPMLTKAIGSVTMLYALFVAASSSRRAESAVELRSFAVCDAGWALIAAASIATGIISTRRGVLVTLALIAAVCCFGIKYTRAAQRLTNG